MLECCANYITKAEIRQFQVHLGIITNVALDRGAHKVHQCGHNAHTNHLRTGTKVLRHSVSLKWDVNDHGGKTRDIFSPNWKSLFLWYSTLSKVHSLVTVTVLSLSRESSPTPAVEQFWSGRARLRLASSPCPAGNRSVYWGGISRKA